MIKFVYTPDKDEVIIEHEKRMLENYSNLIYRYQSECEQYNCSLKVGLAWINLLKKDYSTFRLPFKNGYECYIYCRVERNGEVICYEDSEGEVDYYELSTSWNISLISRFFFHLDVYLCTDTTDVISEMERLLKIVKEPEPVLIKG